MLSSRRVHPRARRAVVATLAAVVATSFFPLSPVGAVTQPAGDITGVVETDPVASSGDAADDTAIWVDPSDPSQSLVIGTDKQAALEVYDLAGNRVQRLPYSSGPPNNVDLRRSVRLGGRDVDVVGASGFGRMRFWTIDPATRRLTDVTAREIPSLGTESGFCLYRSPASGSTYAFTIGNGGIVEQYELFDSNGLIDVRLVRGPWDVGTVSEGCVADDELGDLYISEETVGIWKYSAEPAAATTRTMVDSAGGGSTGGGGKKGGGGGSTGGNLVADVEGLEIVYQANGTGYLLASSQGDSHFNVYERQGDNTFLRRLALLDGTLTDRCSVTDGISAVAADLGPAFPFGLFICQDNSNALPGTSGNQNFKFARLETVVGLAGGPAPVVTTATFGAAADAQVNRDQPGQNLGTATTLGVDRTPVVDSLLRFSVSGLSGPVVGARLRLSATDGSPNGPALYQTGTGWTEGGVTWSTMPARVGTVVADVGSVAAGGWAEWDVSPVVTGEGTYSFDLAGQHKDEAAFASREAADPSRRPQLILTVAGPAEPPPPDTTAPDTTITSGPATVTASTSASFGLTATEAGSTFECSLDGAAFTGCSSPAAYSGLASGGHSFRARATDAAGNTDGSPARWDWTVDTTAPAPGITVVGSAKSESSTARYSITINRPAGTAAGDVMVASIVVNDDEPLLSPPAGWTSVRQDSLFDALRQAVYVKVATASDPSSFSWSVASSRRLAGGITSYSGVEGASPVDASGATIQAGAATALVAPSIVTSVPGTMLVHLVAVKAEGTISPDPSMTERWEASSPAGTSDRDALTSLSDDVRSVTGATGTRTATASAAGPSIAALIALRPAG